MAEWNKIVLELAELIKEGEWEDDFDKAIKRAHRSHILEIADIKTLRDYLVWINYLLHWVPSEDRPRLEIYNHYCKFYFILDQPPVLGLQDRIVPQQETPALTPLSAWMARYAKAVGEFLDTSESLTSESIESFYASPGYNMSDYLVPRGGWKTFN